MLTVFLKQYVDNIIETDRSREKPSPPSALLRQVFDAFNHSHFRDDVYIVLIYCIYDKKSRKLTLSSAGMNVPPFGVERRRERLGTRPERISDLQAERRAGCGIS